MGKKFSESYSDPADYRVLFWNDECPACDALDGEEVDVYQRSWEDGDFEEMFAEAEESCKNEETFVNQSP